VNGVDLYAADPAFAVDASGSTDVPASVPPDLRLIAPDGRITVLHQFDDFLRSFRPAGRLPACRDPQPEHRLVGLNLSGGWVSMSEAGSETCAGEYGDYGDPAGPDLGTQLAAGAVDGAALPLERCPSGSARVATAALDGPLAAYTSCSGRTVLVRDLAHPTRPTVHIAIGSAPRWAGLENVVISGSYLYVNPAGANHARVTVFYWRRRRRLYSLTARQLPYEITLDRHGRLVMAYSPAPGGFASALGCGTSSDRLAWFSPGAPFAHILPVRPCGEATSVLGDRIAFTRLVSGTPTDNVRTDTPVLDTALTTFAGAPARHLVDNLDPADGADGADGDARLLSDGHVEITRPGCGDATEIDFYTLHAVLARGVAPLAACPVSLRGPAPVSLSSIGRLRIELRCPQGCAATARAQTPGGRRLDTKEPLSVEADPGDTTLAAVLTRRSQILANHLTRVRINLVIDSPGDSAPGQRNLSYEVTRSERLGRPARR
jgi:hypothetical protein